MKLPKQFKDWIYAAGLRVPNYSFNKFRIRRKKHLLYNLKGKGHHWRINCHGELECGDTYVEFDRWALCKITSTDMKQIKNKQQFVSAVNQLLTDYDKIGDEE